MNVLTENELIQQGVLDHLAGTESYASLYYQGQLFAQDIINLNHVNGSEGLIQTVWDKLVQFLKWLKNKIKSLFSSPKFAFEINLKDIPSLVKHFNKVGNHNQLSNYEVNEVEWKKEIEKVKQHITQINDKGEKLVVLNNSLIKEIDGLGVEPPIQGLDNLTEGSFKTVVDNFVADCNKVLQAMENANTPEAISNLCATVLRRNSSAKSTVLKAAVKFNKAKYLWDTNSYEVDNQIKQILSHYGNEKDASKVGRVMTEVLNNQLRVCNELQTVGWDVAVAIHTGKFFKAK